MKILNTAICVLNSKYIHSSLAPWCLMAGIDKWGNGGIRAEVIEGTINQRLENILRYICDAKPSVIGFAVYMEYYCHKTAGNPCEKPAARKHYSFGRTGGEL